MQSHQETDPAESLGHTGSASKAGKETRSQKGNYLPQSHCKSVAQTKTSQSPPQSSLFINLGQPTDAAWGSPTSSWASSSLMATRGDNTEGLDKGSHHQSRTHPHPAQLAGQGTKTHQAGWVWAISWLPLPSCFSEGDNPVQHHHSSPGGI